MSNLCGEMRPGKIKWPPVMEWLKAAAILLIPAIAFTVSVHLESHRLSTIPLIDPAGVIQVTAWDLFNEDCLRSGEFPLWNPYTGLGQPHLGAMQPAPFYPLKIVAYMVGGLNGHDAFILLRLLLMGLGVFVLLRGMGTGFGASIFGGLVFGFGGYSLWFLNLVDVNNQVLTPFLMIAFYRLNYDWSPSRHALAAALAAADFLGGHPEALFISLMFSTFFALYMVGKGKLKSGIVKIGGAIGMGALAASAALLPFAEYFPNAWNFHFTGMGFLHLWPQALAPVVSPLFSTVASGPGWELPRGLSESTMLEIFLQPYNVMRMKAGFPYIGFTATACVAVAAFGLRRIHPAGAFFLASFLVASGLSMGLFPFDLIPFVPPFSVMNNAKFFFCEITFSLCVLAGLGADRIVRGDKGFAAMLVLTLAVELALSSFTVHPYVPVDWDESMKAPWVKGLDLGLEGYRFQAGGYFLFPPNLGVVKKYSDIRSSDALFPRNYFKWINRSSGIPEDEAIYDFYPRYFTRLAARGFDSPDADLMSLKYIVTETPLASPEGLIKIRGDDYHLYENSDACPRVFAMDYEESLCEVETEFRRTLTQRMDVPLDEPHRIVVINELAWPGWRAEAGGERIARSDLGLPVQCYDVDGKDGVLTLRYVPTSFRIGLWVSIVTWLMLALMPFRRGRISS